MGGGGGGEGGGAGGGEVTSQFDQIIRIYPKY